LLISSLARQLSAPCLLGGCAKFSGASNACSERRRDSAKRDGACSLTPSRYLLFADADIVYAPDALRAPCGSRGSPSSGLDVANG
jgi:hypothetical protein